MFIQTEDTPNPATLKFLPNREVMGDAPPADFPSLESASASPLAQALFQAPFVESVFFGRDFITITKSEGEWNHIKPHILTAIMDFFVSGAPIMMKQETHGRDNASPNADGEGGENAEIIATIKDILDHRVRPAVAQDGGDIIFHEFNDGVVYLKMRGACAGCPSSTLTLKQGVENLLKHFCPTVTEVRAID